MSVYADCFSQTPEFNAGFRILPLYDSARGYKPLSSPSDTLYYRPIHADIWYPAKKSPEDSAVFFHDLVQLLESRSKFFDDMNDYQGISDELLQYLCASSECTDYNTLKAIATESHAEAEPWDGPFPLVIYFAGLNGMSYENYLLFESLAKKGFMVAAISSIGRYPGNMTLDIEDLMEQVNDARFILKYLTRRNLVSDRIGLIGYSWGGLAATLWAMIEPTLFQAVVSLDGSEQFGYYGREDDKKLHAIRKSEVFKPGSIQASYLHLDGDFREEDIIPDSMYYINNFLTGDQTYLRVINSAHEDFSSFSLYNNESKSRYELIQKLAVNYLYDKLNSTNMFYKNIPGHDKISSQVFSSASNNTDKNQKLLRGTVRDEKTNTVLPYVNIGILNKDIGTTTDSRGVFELRLSDSNQDDKLKISMVGYESKEIDVNDLLKHITSRTTFHLQEKASELREVVVVGKKLKSKTLGNKTESKFFGGKFASDDLGSECVIKINVKQSPVYLGKFQFNISYNAEDTATFRLNLYTVKDGLPFENMLADNIIVKIGKNQTGKIETDLSKYNIVAQEDFFIGIEWIEGSTNSGIVFSAGFVNKGTYYRRASQGRWRKYPMGVGFNVSVKY